MFSFIWWIVGFYWISAGGQVLTHEAPQLYWLCVVFLAFDMFFMVFYVALACVIGIAVCCCLPCIIAILYAVADQEGASEEDISLLPKYKFRSIGGSEKVNGEKSGPFGGVMNLCSRDSSAERALSAEESIDGYRTAFAVGDETLRFWQVFGIPDALKRTKSKEPSPFEKYNNASPPWFEGAPVACYTITIFPSFEQ